MKKLSALFLCLVSTTLFAANSPTLQLPKGMKASTAPLVMAKPMKAQLSCDMYSVHFIDDNHRDVKFLGNSYGQEFNVGTPTDLTVNFPAPYSNLQIFFMHTMVAYAETGFGNFTPYVFAEFFDTNNNVIYANKDATFSINDARSGSNITLRGVYGIDDGSSLFYHCAMTFLK